MLPSPEFAFQTHYGSTDFDGVPYDVGPHIDMPLAFFKPIWGFWTSTDKGDGGQWKKFSDRTFGKRRKKLFHYEVVGNPNILVLDGDRAVRDLLTRLDIDFVTVEEAIEVMQTDREEGEKMFRRSQESSDGFNRAIEWLAANHDAVHVPEHHSRAGHLQTWDVESTIWFRPAAFLRPCRPPS